MSTFKYITSDFRELTHEQMESTPLCSGRLDTKKLYHFLYSDDPTRKRMQVFNEACHIAIDSDKINRCERDLLIAEFGDELTTAAKVVAVSDTLFDNPLDANLQKLQHAIKVIKDIFEKKHGALSDDDTSGAREDDPGGQSSEMAEDDFRAICNEFPEEDEDRAGRCLVSMLAIIISAIAIFISVYYLLRNH